MFLLLPWMLRKGITFPISLATGLALTAALYYVMTKLLAKFGFTL